MTTVAAWHDPSYVEGSGNPPWLPHGLVFVPVEKDKHCRETTKYNWKRRERAFAHASATSSDWRLVQPVAFNALQDEFKRNNRTVIIKKHDADVRRLNKQSPRETVDFIEGAIRAELDSQHTGATAKGAATTTGACMAAAAAAPAVTTTTAAASAGRCEIDLVCGGSPCVNLVGNANYSAGVQTLESLTEDDESRLWTVQKAVVHALGEVYKGRRQQQG